jgi:RNA polymerase sigma-70 factor, ECF subfamily
MALAFSTARTMHNKPELQLIADFRNGDVGAITESFQRHYASSLRVTRRILPARDESQDAVQSAYLSAFRNCSSFRGESSFKTWITKIVINQCVMHLRNSSRQRRWVSLDDSFPGSVPPMVVDQAPTPEDLVRSAEIHQKVVDTAGRLPRPLRDVFVLSTISGLSVAETAKALGLTVPATKTRIFRARSFMRSQLRDMRGKTTAKLATPKQRFSGQRLVNIPFRRGIGKR